MEPDRTSHALCLSCGLCCDGTLFNRVQLEAHEDEAPLRAGGIEILIGPKHRYFTQPCAAHHDLCCQVYEGRPARCRQFRCILLKSFESGAVTWDEARARVDRVRVLKDDIATALRRTLGHENGAPLVELLGEMPDDEELAADRALRVKWAPVSLRLAAMRAWLHRHFDTPKHHTHHQSDGSGANGGPA